MPEIFSFLRRLLLNFCALSGALCLASSQHFTFPLVMVVDALRLAIVGIIVTVISLSQMRKHPATSWPE